MPNDETIARLARHRHADQMNLRRRQRALRIMARKKPDRRAVKRAKRLLRDARAHDDRRFREAMSSANAALAKLGSAIGRIFSGIEGFARPWPPETTSPFGQTDG